MTRNIISILVADRFGALSRIIEIFVSRGFNLDTICSGVCEEEGCQRLTIVSNESEKNLKKILKLIKDLIDVYDVTLVHPHKSIARELMLVKLELTDQNRQEILMLINSMKAEIIELNPNSVSFELIGMGNKLDQFTLYLRKFPIIEMARTGEAAIHH